MYYFELVARVLETRGNVMTTTEVVDKTGLSKQGIVGIMKRIKELPIDVIPEPGGHGTYVWDMKEVRRKLRLEVKAERFNRRLRQCK